LQRRIENRGARVAILGLLIVAAVACSGLSRLGGDVRGSDGITQSSLRARLTIIAADSMQGREARSVGHAKTVQYLVSELTRMGLRPGGDGGTYTQTFYIHSRQLDPKSFLVIGVDTLRPERDFKAFTPGRGRLRSIGGASVVYGGIVGDSATQISSAEAAGRVVLLGVPPTMNASRAYQNVVYEGSSRLGTAVAVLIASLDVLPVSRRVSAPTIQLADSNEPPASLRPTTLLVTKEAAVRLLGRTLEGAPRGLPGRLVQGRLTVIDSTLPTQNVVAVLPGSDPTLRQQYVVLGAHSDHLPPAVTAVDHDAVRALPPGQMVGAPRRSTVAASEVATLAPRRDSIYNGADDDGSGVVALLEVAQAMQRSRTKHGRTTVFVWHSAEESNEMGSEWFLTHPLVPVDSIFVMLNLDMVGRGTADDRVGGGPAYLQVFGATRRSPVLLGIVQKVNGASSLAASIDTLDTESAFCRSDQWPFARRGVPVAFFTTGSHRDYHKVTDEVQYIDFAKLRLVARLTLAVATELTNTTVRLEPPGPRPLLSSFCGS